MASVSILAWNVYVLLIFGFTRSVPDEDIAFAKDQPPLTYNYDRVREVNEACAFVLDSATELKPDESRVYRIKEELYFVDGDWGQDVGNAPLMPFDDGESLVNSFGSWTPLNLVSFWVVDVDRVHRSKKAVFINGVLYMGITVNGSFMDRPYVGSPEFQMWPGHSQLLISFQGVYTESRKNGGEKVMCLLGSTMLPAREPDLSNPWEWAKAPGFNYNQPPLLQDDQIVLVIHYPITFTLTSRAIKGEMRSLNKKSNLKYFDEVHISSQMGKLGKYEFGAEKIVSKACDPYPYRGSLMNSSIDFYKGTDFCQVLEQITQYGSFMVVPNWRCNGTDDFCSKLGPFMFDKEINATDGSFKDVKIYMQSINCEQTTAREAASSARVSAVFRAVPPLTNQYTASQRSGVSNMTISAEGMWKSSSGQLCMVGCRGLVDAEGSSCDSRICLYIPYSFSIKQRSIIVGSFSSIDSTSYFPLSFEMLLQPTELSNYFRASIPSYTYSKIDLAGTLLEKNEPFSFGTVIKKSLLQYPKLDDNEPHQVSFSLLSEDLTLHVSAAPDPLPKSRPSRTELQMEILSLGPVFGRYWQNVSFAEELMPHHTKAEYTERELLLNVSAQLRLTGNDYSNFSIIFLEGLYDPHVGTMYLIGCRDVRASWKILFESMDLEAGLDCLIDVVVSYPPTTARWLINPTARISIASRRTEDDPLHFNTTKLQTQPIMYRRQREDILLHRGVEGILRILTLSLAISFILSQLFYINSNVDSTPYISLVMLGVQALGYSLPLVTGAEAIFKRMESESYEMPSYDLENNQWFHVIDYTVKLLVMVSFLLTLRLCQKVWKSRIRLQTRAPLEPRRVPSDKSVLLNTLIIHGIGFIIVLVIHSTMSSQGSLHVRKYKISSGSSNILGDWGIELEEYMGLVQDFFLLPQIIGNFLWLLDCKPLRTPYFVGITVVRLLPHVYDYIRAPVGNPYFYEDYEFVNPSADFFSKFGDIAIPVTAIILAAAVYVQQRWSYEKLSQMLTLGGFRLLPSGSRMYERLPSKSFEAELASGVNGNEEHDKDRDDAE